LCGSKDTSKEQTNIYCETGVNHLHRAAVCSRWTPSGYKMNGQSDSHASSLYSTIGLAEEMSTSVCIVDGEACAAMRGVETRKQRWTVTDPRRERSEESHHRRPDSRRFTEHELHRQTQRIDCSSPCMITSLMAEITNDNALVSVASV
jgi:hypothetical protein